MFALKYPLSIMMFKMLMRVYTVFGLVVVEVTSIRKVKLESVRIEADGKF